MQQYFETDVKEPSFLLLLCHCNAVMSAIVTQSNPPVMSTRFCVCSPTCPQELEDKEKQEAAKRFAAAMSMLDSVADTVRAQNILRKYIRRKVQVGACMQCFAMACNGILYPAAAYRRLYSPVFRTGPYSPRTVVIRWA